MITTRYELRVRYAETDQIGFAHHSRYLEWFECGRSDMMRRLGYPYGVMEEEGVLLPLVETGCHYHLPAKYDELLTIVTELRRIPRATIGLDYQILRSADKKLLADGFTVHAFVNKSGRAVKPSKKFLGIVEPYFK
ncbi:MAG TPA: acyl-CoA thioesterase [Bacteroidetes bacterium]|nr:acyl-CoA thioesterase [Bacteroidota bacterium]